MFHCLIVHFICGIRVTQKPKFYDYYDVLCVWFAIMRCVHGPCIAALRVLIALIVPGYVHSVCLRFGVGVGLSGRQCFMFWLWCSFLFWIMFILVLNYVHSCFELCSFLFWIVFILVLNYVHSCFELWSALSQSSWIRRYINVTYNYYFGLCKEYGSDLTRDVGAVWCRLIFVDLLTFWCKQRKTSACAYWQTWGISETLGRKRKWVLR